MSRTKALAISSVACICLAALGNAQFRTEASQKVRVRSNRMFAKLTPTAKNKVLATADRMLQRVGSGATTSSLENAARQASVQAFPGSLRMATSMDIEAIAFIVMSQAASDSQSDLQDIMSSIKAINAAKANLRSQIAKIESIVASQQPPRHKLYVFKLARTPHLKLAYPIIGPVDELPKNLSTMSQADLQTLLGELQAKQDALGDMSTQEQMMLQQAMEQKSQFESALSNMLKSMNDTDSAILSNLKD